MAFFVGARRLRVLPGAAFLAAVAACTFGPVPRGPAPRLPPCSPADPISRGLLFLEATQDRGEGPRDAEDAGDWPQWVAVEAPLTPPTRIFDVSPFAGALVHRSLARITPQAAAAMRLSAADAARARRLRRAVVPFLRGFEVRRPDLPAGAWGFWRPRTRPARSPLDPAAQAALLLVARGPRLCGPLSPQYGPAAPRSFGIWPDLDTTSAVHLALGEDADLDGGPVAEVPPLDPFLWARDLDPRIAPRRRDARERPTGAYLTWVRPRAAAPGNELDAIVAARALHALARRGRCDLPGFEETAVWLSDAVAHGRHRRPRGASEWYPDGLALHAEVVRAWVDGPVPGLEAAARTLLSEIEASARAGPEGTVAWPGPDDPYPTALALSALLLAGRRGPLVEGGIRRLLAAQDPDTGSWPAATLCLGVSDSGLVSCLWRSCAVPTALAVEVLALHRLGLARRP